MRSFVFPRAGALWAAVAGVALLAMAIATHELVVATQKTALSPEEYDLVILNGRIMDPASSLDAVGNVGISGGTIRTVGSASIRGRQTIDARGLVVAPGFIDLHAHAQSPEGYALQVRDGVTTAFELEVGTADVESWYAERKDGRLINYGVSVGHFPVRMEVMGDRSLFPKGNAAYRRATPEEIRAMARRIGQGLEQGAVAVGFALEYTEAASHWEVMEMFRAAADYGAAAHVHLRSAMGGEDALLAFTEVVGGGVLTGIPVHVLHIHIGGPQTVRLLQMAQEAQTRGLDVTTECFPYTVWVAPIEAAYFQDWERWDDARFRHFEWPATGERLDRESFARYRKVGGNVIAHMSTEEEARAALASPLTMIASDSYLAAGWGPPRTAGTYSRILGRYVREEKLLPLMEALRKMTIMPARRMEGRVAAMARKGRVQVGADADLTIFDLERVIDRATHENPLQPSEGIEYVLVNGVPVVRQGKLADGVAPGRPVRAPLGRSAASRGTAP